MKISEKHGISDRFFELSRSVFRVKPSYLVFGELSKYVFRKNKSFCEKIFFRDEGSIFDQKSSHLLQSDPSFIRSLFHQKSTYSVTKLLYLEDYLELGEPPLLGSPGGSCELTSLNFSACCELSRCPKKSHPFFSLIETGAVTTW